MPTFMPLTKQQNAQRSNHTAYAPPAYSPSRREMAGQAVMQRVAANRTTSIYDRMPIANNFRKQMEIIDSESIHAYVHISRDAPNNEETVNIRQNAHYFNRPQNNSNRRTRITTLGQNQNANLNLFTEQNNAHITLEGRYAQVMSELANGLPDLNGIKAGPPVAENFNNLNFGSRESHPNQKSQKDIFTYITQYAEDAGDFVRDSDTSPDVKEERIDMIDHVETETYTLAETLINNSPLRNINDADLIHYAGTPWAPLRTG